MKNNLLHIEYNGLSPKNGAGSFHRLYGKNLKMVKLVKADKMYNGRIEKMKCNSKERAIEIVSGITREYIRRAIFQNKSGDQIVIV